MIYSSFSLQNKITFVDLSFQIMGHGEISIILPLLKKDLTSNRFRKSPPLLDSVLAEIKSTMQISLS